MINRLASLMAGNYNEKQLKKIIPLVDRINYIYHNDYANFEHNQVVEKTTTLQKRAQSGEALDDLLPEAYALVKKACALMMGNTYDVKGTSQTWNMIPYDVQLVGGIALHQSTIAEMKTGEGKTLVAALPLYLNALLGKGTHLVTVNDYLASRDAAWMGNLYEFLGLTIGSVTKATGQGKARREQYACDITYIENSELGFDYLRDNLTKSLDERVLLRRPLHYAIVDEIDSILIDEARTPLIISQPVAESTDKYTYYAKIIRNLTAAAGRKKISKGFLHDLLNDDKEENQAPHGDYYIDEKNRNASLTSEGIAKLEKILKVENLYKDLGFDEIHHIENAIKAQSVYRRDQEYIVRDGKVIIVDTNTGRAMPGRRFSQGLHQAIEAKE
jgi:preprotein translocase subunit SecA